METTVILLKPDCIRRGCVGEVIRRFEAAGFTIRAAKMMRLSSELVREHYAHLVSEPFFPAIEAFMMSAPVIALALAADGAINRARLMAGPTDSRRAPAGSIRGDLGQDGRHNIVHAADSPESAAVEVERFFGPGELCG